YRSLVAENALLFNERPNVGKVYRLTYLKLAGPSPSPQLRAMSDTTQTATPSVTTLPKAPAAVEEPKLSATEGVKSGSNFLRGNIAAELNDGNPNFPGDTLTLLKHHGTYEQDNRDL